MPIEDKVAIVLINYRDYDSLLRLLADQECIPDASTVVVVDNTEPGRRNYEAIDVILNIPGVTLLHAENPGYFGGVRWAIDRMPSLRGSSSLMVCNTDLRFSFNDFVAYMRAESAAFHSAKVGVIAPRLVMPDGSPTRQLHLMDAPSARKMSRLGRIFSNRLTLAMYKRAGDAKRLLRSSGVGSSAELADGQQIFAPHGALMIFTSDYLQSPDAFANPSFLFGEEIFVGLHAEDLGLTCIYCASLPYTHEAHGSMGNWPSRAVSSHLRDSHLWAAAALADRSARGTKRSN